MATLFAYARTLWDVQQTVSNKLGYDLRRGSFEIRATILAVDATLALLIKVLTDTEVITDAALNAAVQVVRALDIQPLPTSPPPVPEDGTVIPPPSPIAGG